MNQKTFPVFHSWIAVISILVGSILFFIHSDLFLSIDALHIDSQVYVHAAREMVRGKILYKDVFDHKGPAMYLFECLGILISKKSLIGIWLIQLVMFLAGVLPFFYFVYKKSGISTMLSLLLIFFAWIFRFDTIGDNIPEFFSIGLTCLYFFLYLKISENCYRANTPELLSIGALFVFLFLLKVNFIILLLPSFFFLGYKIFKQTKNFWFLIWVKLGAAIVLFPFFIYFYIHQAFYDAIYSFLLFNFEYVAMQKLSFGQSIFDAFYLQKYFLLAVFLMMALGVYFQKGKNETYIFIISFFVSILVLIAIPGRGAESIHYAIPLAPLLISILFFSIEKFTKPFVIFTFVVSIYFYKPVVFYILKERMIQKNENQVAQFLKRNKKENETLCVIGNHSSLYELSAMKCNTPYFFTYPILENTQTQLFQSFVSDSKKNPANWIVFQSQYHFPNEVQKLLDAYSLQAQYGKEKIYKLHAIDSNEIVPSSSHFRAD